MSMKLAYFEQDCESKILEQSKEKTRESKTFKRLAHAAAYDGLIYTVNFNSQNSDVEGTKISIAPTWR